MLQEPWTIKKGENFITKSHPGYVSHKPIGGNVTRPRAITFTRNGLHASQIFSSSGQTADYRLVKFSGLMFMNVYRAPRPSGTLEPLLQQAPRGPTIVGGDFNAVSRNWQLQAPRQYGNGDQIIEWATAQDIFLITTAGVPTHRDGNVLDLEWSNTNVEALVSSEYHCKSDHKTIAGSVLVKKTSNISRVTPELRVHDQDLDKFSQFFKAWVKPGPIKNATYIEN